MNFFFVLYKINETSIMYAYEMRKSKRGVVKKQFSLLFYFALFCFCMSVCVYCKQQPSVCCAIVVVVWKMKINIWILHSRSFATGYVCILYTLFKHTHTQAKWVKKRKYNFYIQNNLQKYMCVGWSLYYISYIWMYAYMYKKI